MSQDVDSPERQTMIAVRLPLEQADFLRKRAKQNERTVSQEVRLLIRRSLEAEETEAAA